MSLEIGDRVEVFVFKNEKEGSQWLPGEIVNFWRGTIPGPNFGNGPVVNVPDCGLKEKTFHADYEMVRMSRGT